MAKMRSFIDEYLIPWEIEAEMNNGIIPNDASMKMQAKAIEMGLSKMMYRWNRRIEPFDGRTGRYLGRARESNQCLMLVLSRLKAGCLKHAEIMIIKGSLSQRPDGRPLRECYAITEAESGSYETVNISAESAGGYMINGENGLNHRNFKISSSSGKN